MTVQSFNFSDALRFLYSDFNSVVRGGYPILQMEKRGTKTFSTRDSLFPLPLEAHGHSPAGVMCRWSPSKPAETLGLRRVSVAAPTASPLRQERFRSAFFVELHGGRCRCVCASGGCVMQSRAHWPTSVGTQAVHGFADVMHGCKCWLHAVLC